MVVRGDCAETDVRADLLESARISDAVMISPGMVGRDGMLQVTQQKTEEPASL